MKKSAALASHPVQETAQAQTVAALRGELLSKVGNDPAIATELADSLHVHHREDVDALLLAIRLEQWKEVGRYAHRILNTAQLLGCGALVELSLRVEAVIAGGSGQARAALLTDYVPVVEQLRTVLERLSRTF